MSAKKQIIIVSMVFIAIAVCVIFAVSAGSKPTAESLLKEAQGYFESLDYDKAIAVYNDLLRTERSCKDAYLGLAEAYLVKGNTNKAVEILERGLSYAEDDPQFYNKLTELTGKQYIAEAEEDLLDREMADEAVLPNIPQEEPEVTAVPEITGPEPETSAAEETAAQTTTVTEPAVRVPETTQAPVQIAPAAVPAASANRGIKVPNFVGMNDDAAIDLADSLNIDLSLEYIENDKYEDGIIYSQSHKEGTVVSEDTTVDAYVAVKKVPAETARPAVPAETAGPTEDDANVQAFYDAAKAWGELDSSKVRSVSFSPKTSTVTVSASSLKRFTVDESVMEAFAECKNAVLVVNTSSVKITINSSSVTKTSKLDLSANTFGKTTRTTLDMGASGSLNCTANVTLLNCDISSGDLESMNLYYNNKKKGKVSVDSDGNPVITVTSGGQYVIH